MNIDKMVERAGLFFDIDEVLERLAKSDSSIEYQGIVRKEFDEVIKRLNEMKEELGYGMLINSSNYYFGEED